MNKKIICLLFCLAFVGGLLGCSEDRALEKRVREDLKRRIEETHAELLANQANQGQGVETTNKKLEIQNDDEYRVSGEYVYVTGSVKNIGDVPVSYFEVICKFADNENQVLDSAYTNSNIELGVGEMKKFEIMHKNDEKFKKYKLVIGDVK